MYMYMYMYMAVSHVLRCSKAVPRGVVPTAGWPASRPPSRPAGWISVRISGQISGRTCSPVVLLTVCVNKFLMKHFESYVKIIDCQV